MKRQVIAVLLVLVGVATATPTCTDLNCSFNGECSADGTCQCGRGWTGTFCQQLDLLPPHNGSGLDLLHGKAATSTWGGSVLRHDDGKYHGWFSEISRHCGIHRWVTNSVISHAVSDGPPAWSFKRKEEVFPLFSHEPIVARAPRTGEYVMFLTHYPGSAADAPICNCTDGNSHSGEAGCASEIGCGVNKTLFSYFSSAPGPDGPWSALTSLAGVQPGINRTDLNLAPVILADDSLVAWTRWDVWRAANWSNASSYADTGQAPDWNDPTGQWEGEDPSMWIDAKGRYHIVSHNGDRGKGGTAAQPAGDCGRHFFSATGDAGTWLAAPLPKEELGGCAYPRANVTFADGSVRTFYRRERPHIVLGSDGVTPVALTTACIDSPTGPGVPGYEPPQRDASYTLLQPINPGNGPSVW